MAKTKETKRGGPAASRRAVSKGKREQGGGKAAEPRDRVRLRPGELDGLVLAYLREHKDEGPLTPSVVGKGLGGRSSGAVANCLERLVRAKRARLAKRKPRAYTLREGGGS